jgi:hypothetical protein
MLPHPQRRELPQSPHLGERDRFKGMAETKPAAALHLTEDQREAVFTYLCGDNVDLNEEWNLRQFLASRVTWGECDLR